MSSFFIKLVAYGIWRVVLGQIMPVWITERTFLIFFILTENFTGSGYNNSG